MKKFLLFSCLFFAVTVSLEGENIFKTGQFRPSDKTGKICSVTPEGWKISVPPGKEGFHYFNWTPRKSFLFPAGTPVKLGAWMKTSGIAAAKNKRAQLGGRLGLSDGKKSQYMWASGYPTSTWRYISNVGKWNVDLKRCTQNLFIAYYLSGTVWYDDIYFGPFTRADQLDEDRGTVVSILGTPVLDGKLENDKWGKAPLLTGFRTSVVKGDLPSPEKTEFRFLADENNLYVAVKAASKFLDPVLQQLDKFKAAASKDGASALADDSVELFFKRADNSLLQIGCNARGARYTGNGEGKVLSLPWRCRARIENGFWTAELALPWTTLGYKKRPAAPVLFNLGRNSHDEKGVTYSSWAPINYLYKEENVFGRLEFARQAPQITFSDIPNTADPGELAVGFSIVHPGKWKGRAALEVRQKKEHTRELKLLNLAPGKKYRGTLKGMMRQGAPCQVRLVIQDGSGKIFFRSPWRRVICSARYLAVNNIRGAELKVNGVKVLPGKSFALRKGKNLLQLGKGNAKGNIALVNSSERLQIKQGTALTLYAAATEIRRIDVSTGLHVEKGAAQQIPFYIEKPYGKSLEVLVPAPLKVISHPAGSSLCVSRKAITSGGKRYLHHIVKAGGRPKTGNYTFAYFIEVPLNAPDKLPPLRYRVCGRNSRELWQELPLKIMPAFTGKRPRTLRLTMFDGFQYGDASAADAAGLVRTLAKSGINVFGDRKSVYTRDKGLPWVKAVRASGIRLNCELHNKAILGTPERIRSLSPKGRSYLAAPVAYMTGRGRKEVVEKIRRFVAAVQPDEMCFDMECHPDVNFDTSKAGLERFAAFAKLKTIPALADIRQGGKLRKQWIDFCCREVAEYASVLRAGIKAGKPSCDFMVYSAYQGEKNRAAYSIDWRLFKGIADIGSCGYGFPDARTTRATLTAAGKIPFESGELIYQSNHKSLNDLANSVIRRILQGYRGVMFFEVSVVDGFVRRKIADAADLLSRYETFFIKNKVSQKCSVSGALLLKDAWVLSDGNKKLFLYLNSTDIERKGTAVVDGKKITFKVKPFGQYSILLP